MRILIFGSEKYPCPGLVRSYIRRMDRETEVVVTGSEPGVCQVAQDEAEIQKMMLHICEPTDEELRISNIFLRNTRMMENIDRVVIFQSGENGTVRNILDKAILRDLPIICYDDKGLLTTDY